MARSVLGKRNRSIIDVPDTTFSTPRRKRRAVAPAIHRDNDEASVSLQPEQDALGALELEGSLPRLQHPQNSSKGGVVSRKPSTLTARKALSPTKANIQKKPRDPVTTSDFAENDCIESTKLKSFREKLSENVPTTPKHRVKVACKYVSTPRTDRNLVTPPSRTYSVYSAARQLFTQSSSPDRLVGRDQERSQLKAFVSDSVNTRTGGCLYISGPPGTGKSALIDEVLHDIPATGNVIVSTVNCVGFKAAKEIFSKLADDYGAPNTSSTNPEKALASIFSSKKALGKIFIVMLDEIDHLLTNDLEALYSLFEWSLRPTSRLALIGIANALDLTDRFLPRLKARNLKPQLLSFRPYTAPQITSIITSRLQSVNSSDSSASTPCTPFLHPAAIQLCSKKVASQTGDLRKAFNIVRRAIDLIEQETIENEQRKINDQAFDLCTPPKSSPLTASPSSGAEAFPRKPPTAALSHLTPDTAPRATIAHLARITSSIFNSGSTSARLSSLNLQQKAVLCSLLGAEKRRARRIADPFSTPTKAGKLPPSVAELWTKYRVLCKRDDVLHPLTRTEFGDVVGSLETLGLVSENQARGGMLVTPTKTPGRKARTVDAGVGAGCDEKRVVCSVSEAEMDVELGRGGAGSEILKGLLMED